MRTAGVALLLSVAVGTTAFSLQAAALQPTPPPNATAARAANWLLQSSFAASTIDAHGKAIEGRCVDGRAVGARSGLPARDVLLLSNRGAVRLAVPHQFVAPMLFGESAENALLVAGCPQTLGARVAGLAQFDDDVHVRRAWLNGRRVTAIHLGRLILLVAPRTARPLGVVLHGIKSSITIGRMTVPRAASLRAE